MFRISGLKQSVWAAAALLLIHCGGGGGGSSASTTPSAPPPVPMPSMVAVSESSTGDPLLTWVMPTSSGITGVHVYRQVGTSSVSLFKTLPPTATSLLDQSVQEGQNYSYQVRCVAGSRESASAYSTTLPVTLLAPINLTATTVAGGIRLNWTSRSHAATTQALGKASTLYYPSGFGVLPNQNLNLTDLTYTDTAVTPGFWAYRVYVMSTAHPYGVGAVVSGYGQAQGGACMSGTSLKIPIDYVGTIVRSAALNPNGQWAYSTSDTYGNYTHRQMGAAGWTADVVLANAYGVAQQRFGFDGDGFPHYIALVGPPLNGSTRDIVHVWQDLNGWHQETIASRKIYADSVDYLWFGLGPHNRVDLLWRLNDGGFGVLYEWATNESGTWAVAPFTLGTLDIDPTTPGYNAAIDAIRMVMTPDGTAHVALTGYFKGAYGILIKHRPQGGVWTTEQDLPVPALAMALQTLQMSAKGTSDLAIAGLVTDLTTFETTIQMASSTGGVWGAPVVMVDGRPGSFLLRVSPDATRCAVLAGVQNPSTYANELILSLKEGTSSPTQSLIADHRAATPGATSTLDCDQNNRFHVVELGGDPSADGPGEIVGRYDECP